MIPSLFFHRHAPRRGRAPTVAVLVLAALALGSCAVGRRPAVIWTDVPELAVYAELFNASQTRYNIEVRYQARLAEAIGDADDQPDLAVGRYLKSAVSRDRFQSLDYLFGELTVNQASFYPNLLTLGNSGGRQLLLPVSFDLPAIVYMQGGPGNPKGQPTLGLDDLQRPATAWNQKAKGSYTRMGFSPRWDTDFLVYAAAALGAGFREGRPISWSESGLDAAVARLRSWTQAANGTPVEEEEFQFKYLYTPAYRYIADGRALYASMRASIFLLVPEGKRAGLDYAWFAEGGYIPSSPDLVFAGIPRAARDKPAAETFLKWFFKDESQKAMLDHARTTRAIEGSFGIAGGFSAIRPVTEKIFPQYWPALVGHLPPADGMATPGALPADWPSLQSKVVAPWLLESSGEKDGQEARPSEELTARLAAWAKNQGLGD